MPAEINISTGTSGRENAKTHRSQGNLMAAITSDETPSPKLPRQTRSKPPPGSGGRSTKKLHSSPGHQIEQAGEKLVVSFTPPLLPESSKQIAGEIIDHWRKGGPTGGCVLELTHFETLDSESLAGLTDLVWKIKVPGRRIIALVGSDQMSVILRHAHLDRPLEIVQVVTKHWQCHDASDTARVADLMSRRAGP
jgi:hypothetical protein